MFTYKRNLIPRIRRDLAELKTCSDLQIRNRSCELRFAANRLGAAELQVRCLSLASEAIRREFELVPYDVQLLAAMNLGHRKIVEMATGEGKTLTAVLALYLKAVTDDHVLLATANDYLAERDAEFAGAVMRRLGLTVGLVLDQDEDAQRIEAYKNDVTYGTVTQFGFDFLRDRAKRRFNLRFPGQRPECPVMPGKLTSIIVDEADSILIDEATTPLVISSSPPKISEAKLAAYLWASNLSPEAVEPKHFNYKRIDQKVELTDFGRQWVYANLPKNTKAITLSIVELFEFVERAIKVLHHFSEDRNYVITNGEIQLVDQSTGRIGIGRQWSEGIQQAIQAKEKLEITMPNGCLARITLQSFLLAFEHISGMTGTAVQARNEFKKIYKIGIQVIPTNKPCQRKQLASKAFKDVDSWLIAIESECRSMISNNRSVLIGARSIKYSEKIANYLTKQGLQVQLLNARQDKQEAGIVSKAGQAGRITVATNMAGRGTDIELDESVQKGGGLHVILAGIHESKRIDRQLIGRAARQGQPGSFRKFICLEDDLLEKAFGPVNAERLRNNLLHAFSESKCIELFDQAQSNYSHHETTNRKVLFHQEKKQLKPLFTYGMDPILDLPS